MENLNYDVIIIGGGPAGSLAAIAAARNGAKTLLIEQYGFLGGMLTMGGTGPQMTYHAGKTKVVCGIPDEIIEKMKVLGFSPGHMDDFVGYASSVTPFDSEGLKIVLETLVLDEGASLLYHSTFTDCVVERNRIKSVTIHSKAGFFEVHGKIFIDASADADLAVCAGVETEFGRKGDNLAQPMTMNVKVYNVNRDTLINYIQTNKNDMYEPIPFDRLREIPRTGVQGAYSVIDIAKKRGEFSIDRDQVLCFETNNKGEFILNMSRIIKKSALNPFDVTYAEVEGRKQAHEIVSFMRKYIPGFENCKIISTGPHIGVRETRHIQGVYTLTAEDLLENKMFDDAIAMGGYPIDVHSPDGEKTNHKFLKKGSWYSIPYKALISPLCKNLIIAGRCISATHEACAAIRVTPIVMAIGQAAGTAAWQCIQQGCDVEDIDIVELRKKLESGGVFLTEYKK